MGDAIFAGRTFRIDPNQVSWDFTVKTADKPTIGGKVVQVLGTSISNMQVSGSFGVGGWEQQEKFLKEMKAIADEQVVGMGVSRTEAQPKRFLYPPRGWDFLVYLAGYSNPDGSKSVVHDNRIFNPKWTLTFFIVVDNSGINKLLSDVFISRLSRGIGWKQNQYNESMGEVVTQATLTGMTLEDYFAAEFGVGSVPTGNQHVER